MLETQRHDNKMLTKLQKTCKICTVHQELLYIYMIDLNLQTWNVQNFSFNH